MTDLAKFKTIRRSLKNKLNIPIIGRELIIVAVDHCIHEVLVEIFTAYIYL